MGAAVLYDAVTLYHFAVVGRLDVLEVRHGHRPPPRWTDAVRAEILRGAELGAPGARQILEATWLGDPVVPEVSDLREVLLLQVGLNDGRRPPVQHAGEAESIFFADRMRAVFVTDDNAAYDFAAHRIGNAQVLDSIAVLGEAVAMGEMTTSDAAMIANGVLENGRYFRRCHPARFEPRHFD